MHRDGRWEGIDPHTQGRYPHHSTQPMDAIMGCRKREASIRSANQHGYHRAQAGGSPHRRRLA
jgi:hypothetical protein